jgi:dTDP-glucose 4,6-dehydratase
MSNPLAEDLAAILAATGESWEELRSKQLFITGGTGFFGCWLLESFLYANEKLNLDASATVLTRNFSAFERKVPHLANNPALKFISGDVSSFNFPAVEFSHVIHAATDVSAHASPLQTLETIVSGTRRVLDFTSGCNAQKFLFVSSGAVYGKQPTTLSHIGEDYNGAPDCTNPNSAYGEGKRAAELFCAAFAAEYNFEVKIARCFAFVGAYLSLEGNLAVGNFLRNAIDGKTIRIGGDGTPLRSYLYAADLTVWLWTVLFRGESGSAYNVGSDEEISIADLAGLINEISGNAGKVEIANKPNPESPVARYVPSVEKAFAELGLSATVDLKSAIEKTLNFHKQLRTANL